MTAMGKSSAKSLIGKVFKLLTVVAKAGTKNNQLLWKVECDLAGYIKYKAVLNVLNAPGAIRDALATAKAFRDLYASVIKNKGVKIEKIFTD